MDKSLDLFRKRLESALEPHGAIGEFCKNAGVSRTAVRAWLEGAAPSLDLVEKTAEALNTTVWQLLKPEGAESSPVKVTRTAALGEAVALLAALDQNQLEHALTLLRAFSGQTSVLESLSNAKKLNKRNG